MTLETSLTLDDIVGHLDPSQPVSVRTRAIFGLKALNTRKAVQALEHSLLNDPSALIRHEIAYVLGQMKATQSLATLHQVLDDEREDVMVRHEAGEAMGAIGNTMAIPWLQRYIDMDRNCIAREIQETCILALQRIADVVVVKNNKQQEEQETQNQTKYTSIDPIVLVQQQQQYHDNNVSVVVKVKDLRDTLCDVNQSLAVRYRALFMLRDHGGEEAVLALCDGMENDEESALFRHEVAYVLGQMTHPAATQALGRMLARKKEQPMVRHEAAEALGAIATDEAQRILHNFRHDDVQAVRESVSVALDMSDYVTSTDALHYADTLT